MSDLPEVISETISVADILLSEALGDLPYVLLQLVPDPDSPDEPLLKVRSGNGPEEHPIMLPITYVVTAPPEGNPVAEMLRGLWVGVRGDWSSARGDGYRAGLTAVTEQFNPAWLPFVRGEAHDEQ